MPDCECLPKCLFFNDQLPDMPTVAGLYKRTFCQGDKSGCARYQVFRALGREAVPKDLFPNHGDRARELIAKVLHTLPAPPPKG